MQNQQPSNNHQQRENIYNNFARNNYRNNHFLGNRNNNYDNNNYPNNNLSRNRNNNYNNFLSKSINYPNSNRFHNYNINNFRETEIMIIDKKIQITTDMKITGNF